MMITLIPNEVAVRGGSSQLPREILARGQGCCQTWELAFNYRTHRYASAIRIVEHS